MSGEGEDLRRHPRRRRAWRLRAPGPTSWASTSGRRSPRQRRRATRRRDRRGGAADVRWSACSSTRRAREVLALVDARRPVGVQFHGDEDPTYCTGWAVRTIKALRPRPASSAADLAAPYATDWITARRFVAGVPGGTGVAVDTSAAGACPRAAVRGRWAQRPRPWPMWYAWCGRSPWTSPPASRPAPGRRIMGSSRNSSAAPKLPDEGGHFGQYGGRYVAETLMPALLELDRACGELRRDRRLPARVRVVAHASTPAGRRGSTSRAGSPSASAARRSI